MILDGVTVKEYEWITEFRFTPDSQHVAFVVHRDGRKFVFLDDMKGKEYDTIGAETMGDSIIRFSLDGLRIAYTATIGRKWCVVVDGVEGKQYSGIEDDSIQFSPDGRLIAYAAKCGKKMRIVVDGEESGIYDGFVGYSNLAPPACKTTGGASPRTSHGMYPLLLPPFCCRKRRLLLQNV